MAMRTPRDVEAFLRQHHIPGQVHTFPQGTPSVMAAAQAAGVSPQQVVKTLLFFIAGQPVVVIAAGTQRVDYKALARYFGLPRKRVRLATADEVQTHTGYPVGAVPPIAHAHPAAAVLMDPAVLEHREVWAGGGSANALLRIPSRVLQEVTQAQVVPLHRTEPEP